MELNRAQLLVHDDETLERFRRTYDIPTDVRIEHPRPNNVPRIVANNLDRISIRIWLIYQARLQFLISLLLKEVMARYHLTFM